MEIADFGAEAILHEDGIRRVFGVARDFVLENAPDPKRPNILVHCANGSNRSVTVVLALLLLLDGCSLRTAWQTVKSRRNCAMPLRDNRVALVEFEKEVCVKIIHERRRFRIRDLTLLWPSLWAHGSPSLKVLEREEVCD